MNNELKIATMNHFLEVVPEAKCLCAAASVNLDGDLWMIPYICDMIMKEDTHRHDELSLDDGELAFRVDEIEEIFDTLVVDAMEYIGTRKENGLDYSKISLLEKLTKNFTTLLIVRDSRCSNVELDEVDSVFFGEAGLDIMHNKELQISLENELHRLPERASQMISLYFGIGQDSAMTLSEIGNIYGITGNGVRASIVKGLGVLRRPTRLRNDDMKKFL